MEKTTEAVILAIVASMKDVANKKDNSHLTQLKLQIENDEGKEKFLRVIFVPEEMQIDFGKPLGS